VDETEFILIQFFKTCLFVKTRFYLFQMPVFLTFLDTKIWWGYTIKQLPPESPDLSACPWLLRIQIWCLGKFLSFYGLTNFMTSCWNAFGVAWKEVMMIFVCGIFT